MTTIIGVDFSGAQDENKSETWVAQGNLTVEGSLVLESAQPARREHLYCLLNDIPTPAVAAMDFPFGIPIEFAMHLFWDRPPRTMLQLWHAVTSITAEQFTTGRDQLVAIQGGETQRAGDAKYHPYPESYSPLHRVRPNMVPMTYEGINLLYRWHQEHSHRWYVPPLALTSPPHKTVTLLELMPGAFLKAIGFDYATYKSPGYKTSIRAIQKREAILANLSRASGVPLPNLDTVRMGCLANDDCLDSVVAAVGAAMWAQDRTRFRHPADDELPDAQLEGWIYVPKPV